MYIVTEAAVSQVEVHTAIIVDELGNINYAESFDRRLYTQGE